MVNYYPFKIAMIAGEKSGDILGSGLINALKIHLPNAEFKGIAGPLMQKSGCIAWYSIEEISVLGFFEVLSRLPRLLYIQKDIIYRLSFWKPDIFIGIDSPDFNIPIEDHLKKKI